MLTEEERIRRCKERYRRYYVAHAKELAHKRKLRYRNDAKFREMCKRISLEYYYRKKELSGHVG
jgi:hypothetical protein